MTTASPAGSTWWTSQAASAAAQPRQAGTDSGYAIEQGCPPLLPVVFLLKERQFGN